jgi:hypothetical protein
MKDIITTSTDISSTVKNDNGINNTSTFHNSSKVRQVIDASFDGYSSDSVDWYVASSICRRSKVKRGERNPSQLQR